MANLFVGGVMASWVADSAVAKALAWLDALSEETILNSSAENLVTQVAEQCCFEVPSLQMDALEIDPIEEQFTNGGKINLIDFHVPFSGDATLFSYRPSQAIMSPMTATITDNSLIIRIPADNRTDTQIRAEFDVVIDLIQKHLGFLASDLEKAPQSVAKTALLKIQERKSKLLQRNSVASGLGLPLKRRKNAPSTYIAPEIRRKIASSQIAQSGGAKPAEPILAEGEYLHVLKVIENMTDVMERSPSAFEKMDEEAIRVHYLVQLNGQYEGGATGETFNLEGKTDILVRSGGQVIFIAECKIWRGVEQLNDAIAQLFKYLTWRDTKAALIVFNRNKNLTPVLQTIQAALKDHSQITMPPKSESETRFRCVFKHPQDDERIVTVTVLVFDMPSATA